MANRPYGACARLILRQVLKVKSTLKYTCLIEAVVVAFGFWLFLEAVDGSYKEGVGDKELSCVDASDVCSVGDLFGVVTWPSCNKNPRVPYNGFAIGFLLH
jgi:hypothetical protein